jgi:hypothetical protein
MGRKIHINRNGKLPLLQNEKGGNESEGGEKYSCLNI